VLVFAVIGLLLGFAQSHDNRAEKSYDPPPSYATPSSTTVTPSASSLAPAIATVLDEHSDSEIITDQTAQVLIECGHYDFNLSDDTNITNPRC
jgi:hypothetical protein